jgi:hypothetical protein
MSWLKKSISKQLDSSLAREIKPIMDKAPAFTFEQIDSSLARETNPFMS